MTDHDPPRCPRCGSHDLLIVVVENHVTGTKCIFTCDQCCASAQRWVPKPQAVPTT